MAPDLARRFDCRAQAIVDRRDRPGAIPRSTEPGLDRRQPLTQPEAAMWRDFGFRMVYRAELL